MQEIEEGVDYAIMSANYEGTYLRGSTASKIISDEGVFNFEKAGENADGNMTWRIRRKSDSKWIRSYYNVWNGTSIVYTDSQDSAFVCQIRHPRWVEGPIINPNDENYEEFCKDQFISVGSSTDSWIFCQDPASEVWIYLHVYSGGACVAGGIYGSNALYVVRTIACHGADFLRVAIKDLYPNGLDGYRAGDTPGCFGQAELDEANAAWDACMQLINEESSDDTACEAALEKLKAAMEALDASAVKSMMPGFYYMVNLSRIDEGGYGSPYDNCDRDISTLQWNYNSENLTAEATIETVPYIWEFIQDGDLWYIRAYATKRYIGAQASISWVLPLVEEPVGYSIEPITGIPGYFNIRNLANENWCLHAQVSNKYMVYWQAATESKDHASAWTFIKVNEGEELENLRNQLMQQKAIAALTTLTEKATAAYNGTKSYISDLTRDDNWENPGLMVYDENLQNITSNALEPIEGSYAGLTDSNLSTYFHSMWSQAPEPNDKHYLELDLGKEVQEIMMKYAQRDNYISSPQAPGSPIRITILSTDDAPGTSARAWKEEKTINLPYQYPATYTTNESKECEPFKLENRLGVAGFEMEAPHRYIRIVVEETIKNQLTEGYPFFYWSELRLYEGRGYDPEHSIIELIDPSVVQNLFDEIAKAQDILAAGNATQEDIDRLQAAYDKFTEYQLREPVDCALSTVVFGGESIVPVEDEVTAIDHIYKEELLVLECAGDADARITKMYDAETGLLTVTVRGSDAAYHVDNMHTYLFQFNQPKNSVLTEVTYDEEDIDLNGEGTTVIDRIYKEELLALDCAGDADVGIERAYDEETGLLTVTVTGSDAAENPDNVHTYTFQFNLPNNSSLTDVAFGEEEITLSEEGTTVIDHIYNESSFVLECAEDANAKIEKAYNPETGVLTVTITGSDDPANVRTYTFQFNVPKNSVLTGMTFDGVAYAVMDDGKIVVIEEMYDEAKLALECESDANATFELEYDEETGLLIITVSGSDVAENPDNVHTYKYQFSVPPTAIGRLFFSSPQDVYAITGVLMRKQATSLVGLPKGIYVVNGQKVILK